MRTMWNLNKWTDHTALYVREQSYTYGQLDRMQQAFAQKVDSHRLVCVMMTNELPALVAYISCIQNHHPVMVLSAQTPYRGQENLWEHYEPDVIWMPLAGEKEHREFWNRGLYRRQAENEGYVLYERIEKNEMPVCRDLALLLPTSGSTGNPKMVQISYENIQSNTKSICEYMHLTGEDCGITVLPLSYTYGLSVVNTLLYVGGRVCLTADHVMQASFWRQMRDRGITFLPGVPYTYTCMKKMNLHPERYKKLRIMTQAGGRLSKSLQEYWGQIAREYGKEFYIMYGQTEATARISYLPPERCLEKTGSVGIAIPGTQIFLRSPEGAVITEAGEAGEVVAKGSHISMGYAACRADLTQGDRRHQVLETGDIGYLDEEGYLYLIGRKSRFAKVYGKRVNLDDLEQMLTHEGAGEIAVISDDEKVYVVTDVTRIKEQDERWRQRIEQAAGDHCLGKILHWRELLHKESGKIDYRRIGERVKEDETVYM